MSVGMSPALTLADEAVRVPGDTSLSGGIKRFFNPDSNLPPVAERVKQAVAKIDWSKKDIILWMPGTSEYVTNPSFAKTVDAMFPGMHAVPVVYAANWRFETSVPDGIAVLKGVMDEIRRRAPGRKVLIAGQSQGAWIASAIVGDPKYAGMVKRAALFGHPVVSPYHFHDLKSNVVEINNPGDPVALKVNADKARVVKAIDMVARGKLLQSVPTWLSLAIHNPAYLGQALLGQMMRLPIINKLAGDPHHYETDFLAGVTFLKTGKRLGRASYSSPNGVTPRDPK